MLYYSLSGFIYYLKNKYSVNRGVPVYTRVHKPIYLYNYIN